ncbi:hypothetical protein ACQJBY_012332 [Aegilops geniculata]
MAPQPPPLMGARAYLASLPPSPHRFPPLAAALRQIPRPSRVREMVGGSRRGARARRVRPSHQVAAPMISQPPVPVSQLPVTERRTPEAHAEMIRVVRERFPNRDAWPATLIEVIQHATFEERARFAGDDGGMDYELIYWAIQEAESSDPRQAAKWARFRTRNPSRLNIRPPPVVQIANIPPEYLPPGIVLPRVP